MPKTLPPYPFPSPPRLNILCGGDGSTRGRNILCVWEGIGGKGKVGKESLMRGGRDRGEGIRGKGKVGKESLMPTFPFPYYTVRRK